VLRNPNDLDNLALQDGDSIFIPRFNAVVNVAGSVNSPVAVSYSPGKKMDYYIRAAGGPAIHADLSRAYVTQPNGKVDARASHFLIPDHVPEPLPGSTVFVPTRDPTDKGFDFVASAGSIAAILSTIVTVIIALRR
jgi:protein involved in polysaccharide export with SLBB domain